MVLCNLLIFILTLNEVIVDCANLCNKGEKVVEARGKTKCEPCDDGYFQAAKKRSKSCSVCTKCMEDKGSFIKEKCTRVKDTICACREGFSPYLENSAICKCDEGSGLKNEVCSRCEEGSFSTDINSACQKWKQCGSTGIKKAGTATSDVICNELNSSQTTTSPTSIKEVFLTLSTTRRPHEGVQTHSNTTTAPVQLSTVRNTAQPSSPGSPGSHTSTHIGTAILILGIVGLLVLTAMTCKLHITPCWRTKPAVQTKDSLCRRPVEESGDGSELKLNPEP